MGAGPRELAFVFVIRKEFLMTSVGFLLGVGAGGGRKHRGLPQIGDAVCLSLEVSHLCWATLAETSPKQLFS